VRVVVVVVLWGGVGVVVGGFWWGVGGWLGGLVVVAVLLTYIGLLVTRHQIGSLSGAFQSEPIVFENCMFGFNIFVFVLFFVGLARVPVIKLFKYVSKLTKRKKNQEMSEKKPVEEEDDEEYRFLWIDPLTHPNG